MIADEYYWNDLIAMLAVLLKLSQLEPHEYDAESQLVPHEYDAESQLVCQHMWKNRGHCNDSSRQN